MLVTMKFLRKMGLNFQFVKCFTRKDVNSKNIIAVFWFCLFMFWHQNSGNHLKKYYKSCVIPFFCFIIPTPSWPSKLNSDWFFCRLRQWGVWRITWQILSSFLTVFLSDWAWLISQRIQQEKYKCVCNSRVLQSKKNKSPINTFSQGLLILILINWIFVLLGDLTSILSIQILFIFYREGSLKLWKLIHNNYYLICKLIQQWHHIKHFKTKIAFFFSPS